MTSIYMHLFILHKAFEKVLCKPFDYFLDAAGKPRENIEGVT